eukprot:810072-Prymnesium_polylepis.1
MQRREHCLSKGAGGGGAAAAAAALAGGTPQEAGDQQGAGGGEAARTGVWPPLPNLGAREAARGGALRERGELPSLLAASHGRVAARERVSVRLKEGCGRRWRWG